MKFQLSGEYGELAEVRNNIPHHGLDFAMRQGTELHSVMNGTVEKVVNFGTHDLGKGVFVRNEDGTLSIYGHLSQIKVKLGEHLHAGESIGLSGNTGNSTGAHLHYGMRDASGHWIDPTPIADKVANMQGSGFHPVQFLTNQWNHLGDKVIGAEKDFIFHPLQDFLKDSLISLGHTLTDLMPEIGCAITFASAIAIMFTGNFPKFITRWGFGMMGVISWIILGK
ncbi:M23 family metallopeptidase [Neobacillus sp. PS3-40]|uniref:M23 family metallopeptidase n=1 Tax=Neobacillus sp. PS3-40 TaxID=3070679 RepID=UPI0027E136F7|nr:M23 family metallopeptidase [Neobacillus sp. PS3-40]WML44099.1 M23 family metallopeptidase [Neobacillus sp. PS3-40]